MSNVEKISDEILTALLVDFREKELPSKALEEGYDGVTFKAIEEMLAGQPKVDIDLAIMDFATSSPVESKISCERRVYFLAILNFLRHVTPSINDNRKFLMARMAVFAVAEKIFCLRFKMMPQQTIIEWE